jgi:transcriptional regulator GlxA family with amidase domain
LNGYIRALRTLEALDLLTDPNSSRRSLTGIAEASGFKTLQAMRRAAKSQLAPLLQTCRRTPKHCEDARMIRKLIGA